MKLVFEKGSAGRKLDLISPCDVPQVSFEKAHIREKQPRLPHLSENEISRHYTELAKRSHGVNDGFYPLGSCTMKYNPKLGEEAAALPGFTGLHPLQPAHTVQGAQAVLNRTEHLLCEITGMDAVTLQPAAGAWGIPGPAAHQGLPPQPGGHGPHGDPGARLRPRHQPGLRRHGGLHRQKHPLHPRGAGGSGGLRAACAPTRRG